jgi:hypothetical protein
MFHHSQQMLHGELAALKFGKYSAKIFIRQSAALAEGPSN